MSATATPRHHARLEVAAVTRADAGRYGAINLKGTVAWFLWERGRLEEGYKCSPAETVLRPIVVLRLRVSDKKTLGVGAHCVPPAFLSDERPRRPPNRLYGSVLRVGGTCLPRGVWAGRSQMQRGFHCPSPSILGIQEIAV